jgi:hypothetical protein
MMKSIGFHINTHAKAPAPCWEVTEGERGPGHVRR